MSKINRHSFLSFENNKNKLPIVLWVALITIGALSLTTNLSLGNVIYSIVLTVVLCFVIFINRQSELNRKLQVFYDLVAIACILALVLLFGYWGLTYTIFFLVILIIDAFKYSILEYIAIFVMTILSFVVIWYFQDLSIFGDVNIKNTFFLVVANIFFAAAVLIRILAHESLSMQAREKRLLEGKKILEKENEDIRVVFDNMENAIIVFDGDNVVKFANDRVIDIFTVFRSKHNEGIDADRLMLIDSSGRKISLEDIVLSSNERDYRSDLSVKVDGEIKNINLTISKTVDNKGVYKGAIVSLHSLTADEVLERTKNEFSSLASHEIRTPLTAMDGYIYLMLNNKKFEYNELTKTYLTMLHESTTDLIKLANSILQMSKLDDNSIKVDVESVDLAELIVAVANNEEKSAAAKDIKIESVLSKVSLIDTDKVKVTEIITNLVENAIKFTNSGTIKILLDQEGENLVVSVQDSGVGIPDDSKNKIFDKFYQVENYDTRKNSGCGFGLFLSKSLAKRIGGDLVLEDTNENGSVFSLTLPVKYPFSEDMIVLKDKKLKEFIEGF